VRLALTLLASLAAAWLLLLAVLALARPKGVDLAEAKRLVPDLVRLLRALARDPEVGPGTRRRLAVLLAYLAMPIDLVPDVIPVLGQADDVLAVALVLRSIVRRAGSGALDRHWSGTPQGLALVKALAGARSGTQGA
jgi:uncharacterized membrane protein YkvA (DUF1232 family)